MKTQHDSEVLAEGQQVITACALIHHTFDGVQKIFMPKRAATKKFLPDVFELPGGHIDFGEEMIDGLIREVYEEFAMRITVGDPFACFTYKNDIKRSHSIEVIYFATFVDPIDGIQLNPEDHSEYRWVSEEELPELYSQQKDVDDKEFEVVRKGFELLRGALPSFG